MTEILYPDYNVMDQQEHWDDHTRSVVAQRLEDPGPLQFFTEREAAALKTILSYLLAEDREQILFFVLSQMDRKLAENRGDGYHKEGLPPRRDMFRQGLQTLDQPFPTGIGNQSPEVCRRSIDDWCSQGFPNNQPPWGRDFFHLVLQEALSYYYAHPIPWSEIGFGGPAYPRGYVRIERALHDPWEAVKDHE